MINSHLHSTNKYLNNCIAACGKGVLVSQVASGVHPKGRKEIRGRKKLKERKRRPTLFGPQCLFVLSSLGSWWPEAPGDLRAVCLCHCGCCSLRLPSFHSLALSYCQEIIQGADKRHFHIPVFFLREEFGKNGVCACACTLLCQEAGEAWMSG